MLDININSLTLDEKKTLLALIYNVLVSDQDYSDDEKYLFGNLMDFLDVSFDFNTDMISKDTIIERMKKLSRESIHIYMDVVRLAIMADGVVSYDEEVFFRDVFIKLAYDESEIDELIDNLKYGQPL
jgi:hypothetical protein